MTEIGSASSPPLMPIGQILDRIYRVMRAHWRPFFGIALVPAVAIFGTAMAGMACLAVVSLPPILSHGQTPPHIPVYLPIVFIASFYLITIPVYSLYLPAGIFAATQANLG